MDQVQIPLPFVGLLIGAGGKTISKVKRHTGTDIYMLKDTLDPSEATGGVAKKIIILYLPVFFWPQISRIIYSPYL